MVAPALRRFLLPMIIDDDPAIVLTLAAVTRPIERVAELARCRRLALQIVKSFHSPDVSPVSAHPRAVSPFPSAARCKREKSSLTKHTRQAAADDTPDLSHKYSGVLKALLRQA